MVEMTAPAYRDGRGNPAPHREPNFLPATPPNDTSTPDYAVAVPLNVSANFHEVGRSFSCPSQTLNIHTVIPVISLNFTVLHSHDLRWVDPLCFLTDPQIRKKKIRRKPLPLSIDHAQGQCSIVANDWLLAPLGLAILFYRVASMYCCKLMLLVTGSKSSRCIGQNVPYA